MVAIRLATGGLQTLRLITLDMTGTVFRVNIGKLLLSICFGHTNFHSAEAHYIKIVFIFLQFKRAPFLDYIDVAELYGINNVNKKDMPSSFKQAIKSVSKDYPHFGATSNLTSEEWWLRVIQDTFKGKLYM